VLAIVLVLGVYGSLTAIQPRVERVRIETAKLPPGIDRVRVVQISDLHLGLVHRRAFLQRIVRRIEELHPDLLVATGDIVDAQINHLDGLAELFAALRPPLGKYAVTGNHEFYAGPDQALDFIGRSGFHLLRNAAAPPDLPIRLVGVEDPAGGGHPDEASLLQPLERNKFIVLLKHRPHIAPGTEGLFDLQLSGHTHGGQIFPFNVLTRLAYPRPEGLLPLAGGSRLYTSRGTGTWGPPMRVFVPPEITLFELVRAHPPKRTPGRSEG
jgi:predicted MPP superfamily phosphohydrolase